MSGKRVEDPRCASLKNGELQVIADNTELVAAYGYRPSAYLLAGVYVHRRPRLREVKQAVLPVKLCTG